MDTLDRRLLDQLQADVPLVREPYEALANSLGSTAVEVCRRIDALRESHVIRQISAIFDSRKLGYQSSLVAFRVSPEALTEVAQRVSAHPGVSHNYERDFDYNLWFTIAVPPAGDLEEEVATLAAAPSVSQARLLPTIRVFKVGVRLGMEEGAEVGRTARSAPPEPENIAAHAPPSAEEIEAIRILQRDLPTASRPFADLARGSLLSEDEVLAFGEAFRRDSRMRRFAAVLHHRDAGYQHNAMVLWQVPDEDVHRAGRMMASFEAVSHCYERPTFDDLPFSLYTMVHGRSVKECDTVIREIAEAVAPTAHRVVYSTTEFKKVRVRYFEEPDAASW